MDGATPVGAIPSEEQVSEIRETPLCGVDDVQDEVEKLSFSGARESPLCGLEDGQDAVEDDRPGDIMQEEHLLEVSEKTMEQDHLDIGVHEASADLTPKVPHASSSCLQSEVTMSENEATGRDAQSDPLTKNDASQQEVVASLDTSMDTVINHTSIDPVVAPSLRGSGGGEGEVETKEIPAPALNQEGQSFIAQDAMNDYEEGNSFGIAAPKVSSEQDLDMCTTGDEELSREDGPDDKPLFALLGSEHVSEGADNAAVESATQACTQSKDVPLFAPLGGEDVSEGAEGMALESATQVYTESKDMPPCALLGGEDLSEGAESVALESANHVCMESRHTPSRNEFPDPPASQTIEYRQDDVFNATQNYADAEMPPPPPPTKLSCTIQKDSSTEAWVDATQDYADGELPAPPPPAKQSCSRQKDSLAEVDVSATQNYEDVDKPSLQVQVENPCIGVESFATQDYGESLILLLPDSKSIPGELGSQREFPCQVEDFSALSNKGAVGQCADLEEIATQQYVDAGGGAPGSLLYPMQISQSVDAGYEVYATQRYADDIDMERLAMPPPPVPNRSDRGRMTDSVDLAEDCATQRYEEKVDVARAVLPPQEDCATQRYEEDANMASMAHPAEDCATQCYEEDANLTRMSMPPPPVPRPRVAGSLQKSATQGRATDYAALSTGGPVVEDEVAATQVYVDTGRPNGPPAQLEEVAATQVYVDTGRPNAPPAQLDDMCLTQCYNDFKQFSGSICIVPDDVDSSEEEADNTGVRKRPAAAVKTEASIKSLLLRSPGTASSSTCASTSRKRTVDMVSPPATRVQEVASTPKRRLVGKQKMPSACATLSKPTPVKVEPARGSCVEAFRASRASTGSNNHVRKLQDQYRQLRPQQSASASKALTAKSLLDEEEDDDEVMWLGEARPGVFASA
jgi:hypothetical protein